MSINLTDFEDTFQFSQEAFLNLEGKEGFELYQSYRDALLNLLIDKQGGTEKYARSIFEVSNIIDLDLIDQKYIDNFLLCIAIKATAPDSYEDLKKIIDKNIKPDTRSQGWAHIFKEMSGAFAYFLELYEGVTARQAYHVSSCFFRVSESVPRARHLKQRSKNKISSDKLPDLYTLALLFICLLKQDASTRSLKAISPNHARSNEELRLAIQGYERFKKRVFDNYIGIAEELLALPEKTVLHEPDEDLRLDFLINKNYSEIPSEYEVLVVILIAMGMELMPNFMRHPHKFLGFSAE